ncbi:hypothetical protein P7H00_11060 [Enterococcus pseudoavium]|uniref:Uncharacterized protein n=1 Tax=Enterococcus pseudoavium TaxID=44007 RepID=A0AAE4I152_9ENTE|nr:hypothetical protein [Enterococcus pseudoavium]MDT2737650.1 hypothetical protein [Enterococcus pseudoavium]
MMSKMEEYTLLAIKISKTGPTTPEEQTFVDGKGANFFEPRTSFNDKYILSAFAYAKIDDYNL